MPGLARHDLDALRLKIAALEKRPLLAGVLLSAVATNLIGISAIFGAFLFGVILSDRPEVREAVAGRMWDFVTTFFLPIYFTYTGLRTDVGSLGGLWWVAAAWVRRASRFRRPWRQPTALTTGLRSSLWRRSTIRPLRR